MSGRHVIVSRRTAAAGQPVQRITTSTVLGVTARVTIMGRNVRDALSIPRQALHQKEGKPVVYVRNMEGFEPCEVQVKYLTEGRAIIDGIDEGAEVALVNPEQQKGDTAGKTGPLAPILAGGAQ